MRFEKELNEIAIKIINSSGEAKNFALQALKFAKEKNFEKANEYLKLSTEKNREAQELQLKLIYDEAEGKKGELNFLMILAQDNLSSSLLAKELIGEIIQLYKL